MTTFRSTCLRSCLLALLPTIPFLTAQAPMYLRWGPNAASGSTYPSGQSSTLIGIGNSVVVVTHTAGQSAAQCAAAAQAGLVQAGLQAQIDPLDPSRVCLPAQACRMDVNDTGLGHGIEFGTRPTSVGPDGVEIPKLLPSEPAAQGPGSVLAVIEVEFENTFSVQVVKVVVQPGTSASQVEYEFRQELESQGFLVQDGRSPSLRNPGAMLDTYCISHTVTGGRIKRIDYSPVVPGQRFERLLGMGGFPAYGSCNYARSFAGNSNGVPVVHAKTPPRLGQVLVIESRLAGPAGLLLASLQPLVVPLPFGPGAWLACDPAQGLVNLAMTNPLGIAQYAVPVPPLPSFVGTSLYWQAADAPGGSMANIRLSDGLRTTIW